VYSLIADPVTDTCECVAELLVQSGYGSYSTKVDIFAAGLLFVYMLTGRDVLKARESHAEQRAEYEEVFCGAETVHDVSAVLEVRTQCVDGVPTLLRSLEEGDKHVTRMPRVDIPCIAARSSCTRRGGRHAKSPSVAAGTSRGTCNLSRPRNSERNVRGV
jgi:hypothetical protein